jgi:hypothetical protein
MAVRKIKYYAVGFFLGICFGHASVILAETSAEWTGPESHAENLNQLEPYLAAYDGGGTVTIGDSTRILVVRSSLRGIFDSDGRLTRDVLVTTTMTVDGRQAATYDYQMSFTDYDSFNILVAGQIVGQGRCNQTEATSECSVSIPLMGHHERFVLTRPDRTPGDVVSKRIQAEGTTTLNGEVATLRYTLIGSWPGFSCRDQDERVNADVVHNRDSYNVLITRLDNVPDQSRVRSGVWYDVTRNPARAGTFAYEDLHASSLKLRLDPERQDSRGFYSGSIDRAIVFGALPSVEEPLVIENLPILCVRNL